MTPLDYSLPPLNTPRISDSPSGTPATLGQDPDAPLRGGRLKRTRPKPKPRWGKGKALEMEANDNTRLLSLAGPTASQQDLKTRILGIETMLRNFFISQPPPT